MRGFFVWVMVFFVWVMVREGTNHGMGVGVQPLVHVFIFELVVRAFTHRIRFFYFVWVLVREGTNHGVGVGVAAIGNEIIFEAVVHAMSPEAVVRALMHCITN